MEWKFVERFITMFQRRVETVKATNKRRPLVWCWCHRDAVLYKRVFFSPQHWSYTRVRPCSGSLTAGRPSIRSGKFWTTIRRRTARVTGARLCCSIRTGRGRVVRPPHPPSRLGRRVWGRRTPHTPSAVMLRPATTTALTTSFIFSVAYGRTNWGATKLALPTPTQTPTPIQTQTTPTLILQPTRTPAVTRPENWSWEWPPSDGHRLRGLTES